MNTEKIIKESKVIMNVTLIVGLVLLAVGVILNLIDIKLIPNNKAIIGLSFMPLSVALTYYLKISRIKKSPQKMRNIITEENDERLVALKNEADAKAFKIFQGILFLTYMGYTLTVPKDIFESVGWWLILMLLFVTFIAQGIMLKNVMGKNSTNDLEE